jgi:hypothetical protein
MYFKAIQNDENIRQKTNGKKLRSDSGYVKHVYTKYENLAPPMLLVTNKNIH